MSLAIVGAGLSGVAAAHALRDAPLDVTLFEKSRGVSGRAATRRRDEVCYDHGANHFKIKSERFRALVHEVLPTDRLAEIDGDVWTFGEEGELQAGDPEKNAESKWTYRDGVSRLGKLLAASAGARLQTETRIAFLTQQAERGSNAWTLTDAEGHEHGPFDAVLLTPPAPQTTDLIEASRFADEALQERLAGALAPVTYRTQLTLVLAYRGRVERPEGCYGLLNTDGAHEIAWMGFEEEKPGHVPVADEASPESVLVVQMAPGWSRPRFRAELEALVPEVIASVGQLLGADLGKPDWADKQGWRYALPEEAADAGALATSEVDGLFFAGDALEGQGRIGVAVESGLDAGARIRQALLAS